MVKRGLNKYLLAVFLLCWTFQFSHAQKGGFEFVENKGQWDEEALYRSSYNEGYIEITKTGYRIIRLFNRDNSGEGNLIELASENREAAAERHPHSSEIPDYLPQIYEVRFVDANTNGLSVAAEGKLKTIYNYYQGPDPKKWASGCRGYASIWIKNIYPHIDVHFYQKDGLLKYDIIVNPEGDANKIALDYLYIDKISVDKDKRLQIQTSTNYFVYEHIPLAYKEVNNKQKKIPCSFLPIGANRLKFQLKNYRQGDKITIDPEFIFSTFSGSKANNLSYTSSFDREGNFLGGSIVISIRGFPITPGNTDYNANNIPFSYDAGFMKINADGSDNLAACVFGSNHIDAPISIKEAPDSSIIIVGKTASARTFPSTLPSIGPVGGPVDGPVNNPNYMDLFIVKLDKTGKLLASVVIGGSDFDGFVERGTLDLQPSASIAGDVAGISTAFTADNNLIIAAPTRSNDFPIAGIPYPFVIPSINQRSFPLHVALMKFSLDLKTLFFSGYIGGSDYPNDDKNVIPQTIKYNKFNNKLYLVGVTSSDMLLANTTIGNYQGGQSDGYIMTISLPTANSYTVDTVIYVGASGGYFDGLYNIDFDGSGYPYVIGSTTGDFPIKNAAFSQPKGKQFIVKYEKDFSNTIYSTTFGPNAPTPSLTISGFLVDFCENVYVSGWGGPSFIPSGWRNGFAINAPDGTLRSSYDPSGDYYIIVIAKNAAQNLYSGFLGVVNGFNDHFHFGENRFDDRGILYQTVCICATNTDPDPKYPIYGINGSVWSDGIGRNKNSPGRVFVPANSSFCNPTYTKINFDYSGTRATLLGGSSLSTISRKTVVGCAPFTVIFADQSPPNSKGKVFHWHFEDGSPDRTTTTDTIHHIFTFAQNQRVRLISEDTNSCSPRDTSYIELTIKEGTINLGFRPRLEDCSKTELRYTFINTSTSTLKNIDNKTLFLWDFGDGSPIDSTYNLTSIRHIFKSTGTYTVTLRYLDPMFCSSNQPGDTIAFVISTDNLRATADVPTRVCLGNILHFTNTSEGYYETFTIDWGDGSPFTVLSIGDTVTTHMYTAANTYQIRYTASFSQCNVSAQGTSTVKVDEVPTADFDFSPKEPGASNQAPENAIISFDNLSQNASSYEWNFGDGVTSNLLNPSHQFLSTGQKEITLVAKNNSNCADTTRKTILTSFMPILEVPKAFSPNGDKINDEIKVEQVGIIEMIWKIYTRRGDLIFETTDPNGVWNGNSQKGDPMPIDTYFYSVEGKSVDGQTIKKSGEITLLK